MLREPTVLDSVRHRQLRMMPISDHSMAAEMHVSYLTAVEFAPAAVEYAILFVRTDDPARAAANDKMRVSPVVLLGLIEAENLFIDGTRWDAHHVPNFVRRYPFWTSRVPDQNAPALMFDAAWRGFSQTEGEPLFTSSGEPAQHLSNIVRFIEDFDNEAGRTQKFCDRLVELDLLRAMAAKVTLPADNPQGSSEHELTGFYAVETEAMRTLSQDVVMDMYRSGMLGLVQAHTLSMLNVRKLVDRKMARAKTG
jgi:hypothetical protein